MSATISKNSAFSTKTSTFDYISDFFVNHLHFTPTAGQIEQFERDIALVSPKLLAASLHELQATEKLAGVPPRSHRTIIFEVYNRKVAEHARLFPILHTFEVAFRSTAAVMLEEHYKLKDWWMIVHRWVIEDKKPLTSLQFIGSQSGIPSDTLAVILEITGKVGKTTPLESITDGFMFIECCTMTQMRDLITYHWPVFKPRFPNTVTKNAFAKKFETVTRARNDIYHHKSVARTTKVVEVAEELLDHLDCSLRFIYEKISEANVSAPPFKRAIMPRHRTQ